MVQYGSCRRRGERVCRRAVEDSSRYHLHGPKCFAQLAHVQRAKRGPVPPSSRLSRAMLNVLYSRFSPYICMHVCTLCVAFNGWVQVTVNGKTIKAVQGQRLRDVVLAAKAKIEYGCEKVRSFGLTTPAHFAVGVFRTCPPRLLYRKCAKVRTPVLLAFLSSVFLHTARRVRTLADTSLESPRRDFRKATLFGRGILPSWLWRNTLFIGKR